MQQFSLDIADREFVVLVGPSGCGKSTTLRMIAGLEEITDGELYIDDKLMNDVAPKDRNIAMVFQNYALYPHMTVYENMAFSLKLKKCSKEEIDKRGAYTEYHRISRQEAQSAFRRTAAARCNRPRHRAQSGGIPYGRAAFKP